VVEFLEIVHMAAGSHSRAESVEFAGDVSRLGEFPYGRPDSPLAVLSMVIAIDEELSRAGASLLS